MSDLMKRLANMAILSRSRTPSEAIIYIQQLEAKLAKADVLAVAIERRMVDLGGFDNRFGLRKALNDYYRTELKETPE